MRPRDYGNKLRARRGKPKPKAKNAAPAAPPRDSARAPAPRRESPPRRETSPRHDSPAPLDTKQRRDSSPRRESPSPRRESTPPRAPTQRPAPRQAAPPVLTSTTAKKTLDRVLSKAGLGSRTDAEEWINDGRVKVNGRAATSIEMWIDPKRDKVTLDGAPVLEGPKLYILLNKPKGYITTYKDPEGRPTVYQLLKGVPGFVGTAGRLDMDTSGLLILTNDTAFADFITSPASHVLKTYLVKSSTRLTDDQLNALRAGPALDDGPTRPALVTRLRDSEKYTHFEITISEGRNRQVRRMVEAVGSKVLKLVRVKIGGLSIDGLQIGTWRPLTANEVKALIGAKQ